MKHIVAIFLILISCMSINAEVRIHMEKEAGVYKVPCSVNGLKLKFIFDTGAASVCISQTYAEMMLENGYLDESDILGKSQSTIADGSNIDNVVINLRKVEIGGLSLENVSAVVVPTQNAPLLLGQSVIQRLGKVSFDGEYLVIHNAASQYTEEELDAIFDRAENLFEQDQNLRALESYRIIYEVYGDDTNPWVLYKLGICSSILDNDNAAIQYYLKAIELANGEDDEDDIKYEAYYKLGLIYSLQREYNNSIKYYLLASEYVGNDLMLKADCYNHIAYDYGTTLNYNKDILKAIEYYKKSETIYVSLSNINVLAKASLYKKIADCYCDIYNNRKDHYKAIEYYDKAINAYNSWMKNNRLEENDIFQYIDSFYRKGESYVALSQYNHAIDASNLVKEKLKLFKSEITNRERYETLDKAVNAMLSHCYRKLNE